MITLGLILGLVATFLFILWYFRNILKFNMPPGPWGLPVVGYLPFLGAQPQETFLHLKKKYGDVYTVQLGSFQCIVVNGRNAIKDMLLNSVGVFDTRPAFYSYSLRKGRLVNSDYSEKWLVLKKLVVEKLAEFVNNKQNAVQSLLEEEASLFLKDIRNHNGKPFDPKPELYVTFTSVLYQIMYGRREDIRKDEEFRKVLTLQKAYVANASVCNPTEVMPWLSKVSYSLVKPFHDLAEYCMHALKKNEVEHRRSFMKNNARDLTDVFLELDGDETSEMKSVGVEVEDLILSLEEMFSAGFDSTPTTMHWIILILVRFPLVQRQVFDEIQRVVGDRTPKLDDRHKLPYTEAVILESMRYRTPLPLGIPHCTEKYARTGSYVVPEGTPVIFNLHSLTRDPHVWENPNGFYPEHFLSTDGEVDRDKAAMMSPFGMGKRKCVGEEIARNSLFLCLVNLIQKFEVIPVDGENYNLTGISGFTDSPKPYNIIALER